MTVKELKEALKHYNDDAEVIVAVSDNTDEYWFYPKEMYDTWVQGNKDEKFMGEIERNSESDEVYIKVYR